MPGERTINTKVVYTGRVVRVRVDTIRMPDGGVAQREVVEHADAVHILAMDARGHLLLVRQYRNPADKELLEVPAGGIRPGEAVEEAAQRELREETGYRAGSLERVTSVYSTPGFCTELNHLLFAWDLTYDPLPADSDESIRVVSVSPEEALRMVKAGEVGDAKSVTALLLYLFARGR